MLLNLDLVRAAERTYPSGSGKISRCELARTHVFELVGAHTFGTKKASVQRAYMSSRTRDVRLLCEGARTSGTCQAGSV